MKISCKINSNKAFNYAINRPNLITEPFILRTGFIYGFIGVELTPYIYNGTIFKTHINIYMPNFYGVWESHKILADTEIYDKLVTFATKQYDKNAIKKNYSNVEDCIIENIRAKGKTPELFSKNSATSKRDAKRTTKRIKNLNTEFNYWLPEALTAK